VHEGLAANIAKKCL